ncbi:MAG: transketolase [Oscillospiraceae bacterium]|nr:transketolase [Oscillospiraceae bacterium]
MLQYKPSSFRMWSRLGPSGALNAAAMELPAIDERVVFVTADLCFFSGLERFAQKYPDKIFNVGIAEQNLIGFASGMYAEGLRPFVTTYATFASLRAAEQIKVNMAYMQRGVKVIGLTAGFAAGILGATHMALEDIAAIRAMPGIIVVDPADCTEMVKAITAAAFIEAPMYIRFTGPINCPQVYSEDYFFEIGKAIRLRMGTDVEIVACGSMVYRAIRAAELLEQRGISCGVTNMHTVNPLDTAYLDALKSPIVTVEEHCIRGGLGAAVCEYLSATGDKSVLRIGVDGVYPHAGNYEDLLEESGLTENQIAERIERELTRRKL